MKKVAVANRTQPASGKLSHHAAISSQLAPDGLYQIDPRAARQVLPFGKKRPEPDRDFRPDLKTARTDPWSDCNHQIL